MCIPSLRLSGPGRFIWVFVSSSWSAEPDLSGLQPKSGNGEHCCPGTRPLGAAGGRGGERMRPAALEIAARAAVGGRSSGASRPGGAPGLLCLCMMRSGPDKPGSVVSDHLSWRTRRRAALRTLPERGPGRPIALLFALAPDGVYPATMSPRCWWSLTPPFQLFPLRLRAGGSLLFCGTFRRVVPPGR